MGRAPAQAPTNGRKAMTKLLAVLAVLASFLLVAPVIESGTSGSTQIFQAIGTADGAAAGTRITLSALATFETSRLPGETKGGSAPLCSSPLSLVLVALVARRARRPRSAAAAPASGGVYRRPLGNDPATLDPARISDIYGRSVAQQIFDGLVQFDHTLDRQPGAGPVTGGPRATGSRGRSRCARASRFHHGREVTADDVVYLVHPHPRSAGAVRARPTSSRASRARGTFREGRARAVAGLCARSTATPCRSRSTRPSRRSSPSWRWATRRSFRGTSSSRRARRSAAQPVGTGPFRFDRWERGKEIVLAANPTTSTAPRGSAGSSTGSSRASRATRCSRSSSRASSRTARCRRSAGARSTRPAATVT